MFNAFGLTRVGAILGIIGAVASFGSSILAARSSLNWKTLFAAISSGATAASRTLTFLGYRKLGQIFGLISTVTGFISTGLKPNKAGKGLKWNPSNWEIYKFARSSAEQVANLAGAVRVAGFLNVFGIIDDVGDSYLGIRDFLKNDVAGGEKVYKLDFLKNTKRLLTGCEEINARFGIFILNLLRRANAQTGRINSSIRRIERGIALAH